MSEGHKKQASNKQNQILKYEKNYKEICYNFYYTRQLFDDNRLQLQTLSRSSRIVNGKKLSLKQKFTDFLTYKISVLVCAYDTEWMKATAETISLEILHYTDIIGIQTANGTEA